MIKQDPLTGRLVAVLAAAVVTSLVLFGWYVLTYNRAFILQYDAQRAQVQLNQMRRNLELFEAMVLEAREYSKRNPAIEPVLRQLMPSAKPAPAIPPAPAPKPPTR